MTKLAIALALAGAVTTTGVSASSVRHYVADVSDSSWQLEPTSNPLYCELTHSVGWFGKARFTSEAGRNLNMIFQLDLSRLPDTYAQATVHSVPPAWMPGVPGKLLAQMDLQRQFAPELDKELGWTLLSELEKGFWPSFSYTDWYNPQDRVAVSLNSANFLPAYQAFVNCVGELLPFSFEDIRFTVLNFKNESVELTRYATERLAMIAQYLRHDRDLELVLVAGHAAPRGPQSEMPDLALRRAEQLQAFFSEQGVEGDRVVIEAFADSRQSGTDDVVGNRLNRRVVVQLNKF